jgi:YHS domain-containing protein
MAEIAELSRRIQDKLAASEERLRLRQDHMQGVMQAAEEAQRGYTATADQLMESIIRPRVAALKAQLEPIAASDDSGSRHTCCLRFSHTQRFPAAVSLEIGITRDGDARTLIVEYRVQILPVFFPFVDSDNLKFTIEHVDPEQVTSWLDDKLVGFVETYLRLEVEDRYHDENRVIDPVCGMSVNRAEAPARAEYGGKTYYFCVQACRDRFLADPVQYVSSPSGPR